MRDVYVAVGGNVDPLTYLPRALELLGRAFGEIAVSPAYSNPAVGFNGDDFINLVVRIATSASVAEVREALQAIEAQCDRPRSAPKYAPRTMDLDMLLYGDLVTQTPPILPRPDLARRPYMLRPMAELAPDLVHPTLKRTMRQLWQGFAGDAHVMTQVTIPRCAHRQPPESGR